MNVYGKIPAKVLGAFKKKNRFTYFYDQQSGHYLVSKALYTTRQAAAKLAAENGYHLDIEALEDIRLGWAAHRFNGMGPSRYCEVDTGARGAFPVWIFPVIVPGD